MQDVDSPVPVTSRRKWALKWLLAGALLGAVLYVLISNKESIARLQDFEIWFLVPLALATAVKYGVAGKIQNDLLKEHSGIHLRILDWYSLSVSTAFYNLFLPAKAGTMLRAIYLKKLHGLDISAFIQLVIQKSLHIALFTSAWGALLIWLAPELSWLEKTIYFLVATMVFAVFGFLIFSEKFANQFLTRFGGIKFRLKLRVGPRMFWQLCLWTFVLLALSGLEYYFSFRAVKIETAVLHCMIAGAVISLSAQFSLTPGNLGIRELFAGFALKIMGYTLADALLVSLVSRSVTLLDTVLLGSVGNLYLARSSKKAAPNGSRMNR